MKAGGHYNNDTNPNNAPDSTQITQKRIPYIRIKFDFPDIGSVKQPPCEVQGSTWQKAALFFSCDLYAVDNMPLHDVTDGSFCGSFCSLCIH